MDNSPVFLYIILVLLLCFLVRRRYFNKTPEMNTGPNLPPEPESPSMIRTFFNGPSQEDVENDLVNRKESHGPISSLTVMGKTLIFIHDREIAHELLNKTSSATSGRPATEFGSKMCAYDRFFALQPYNDRFRKGRKLAHQMIGTGKNASRFYPVQEEEVCRFLVRLMERPDDAIKHLRTASANILKMTYGYSASDKDPLVELIEQVMISLEASFSHAGTKVDMFPAIQHIPEGFPGTGFKKTARRFRTMAETAVNIPFSLVRQRMQASDQPTSYVSSLIERQIALENHLSQSDESIIKWTAGSMYLAGADTIVGTLASFILASILFPDAQAKAQEELDRVIGTKRLPTMKDRDKLPYVDAMVKEIFRWNPVAPFGIAHLATNDVILGDYTIPKDAVLIPAIWSMCNDPDTYPDPRNFKPERHLGPDQQADPRFLSFGFGRRRCPGRYFADASVFLTIASMLAVFNIGKAVDELGREIEPKLEISQALLNHPEAFPYKITPRGPEQVDKAVYAAENHSLAAASANARTQPAPSIAMTPPVEGQDDSAASRSSAIGTRTSMAEIDNTITRPGSVKINVKGAFIVDAETSSPAPGRAQASASASGSPTRRETSDIRLPNHTAVIGGSLIKLVYFSREAHSTEPGGRLNFQNFETDRVDDCVELMKHLRDKHLELNGSRPSELCVMATGGGAYKFYDKIRDALGVDVLREDEMECLIIGQSEPQSHLPSDADVLSLDFFITEIPREVFTYSVTDPMHFVSPRERPYPYLLVNIGSGVSFLKVTGQRSYQRVGGTSLGGGTLWGLLSLLTGARTFGEMLDLAGQGDNAKVDMLVGDIYGTDYGKIGLKSTAIASSFGKVFRLKSASEAVAAAADDGNPEAPDFGDGDISRSLLYAISNNIGHIAYLQSQIHNLSDIYFGGSFIRGHRQTMNTLSYAIKFWSNGLKQAYFLRHEGYLGAVGAFLKRQPKNWGRRSSLEGLEELQELKRTMKTKESQ
ncbi:hypothetical protein L249_8212 [Ophiocordyceps polyrhachis-furcata BCC 54312]|uniref:Pantothenate kinase n=1 Tax=Ophiocordyceps polyrhachis-furcata BCC 54312 TaxID=1330021 RepID=A0A367LGZ6_9HYPO|nr:hypothetical protein L249_8212 [Ophiocordyceps polyrhachis-furcata BCC 54312]